VLYQAEPLPDVDRAKDTTFTAPHFQARRAPMLIDYSIG